jgi:hypothetical protein
MWYWNLDKTFISRHILHQHWCTCPIALPVRRNPQYRCLLTVVSVTSTPPFQPLRHQRNVCHLVVNRFTRRTLHTVRVQRDSDPEKDCAGKGQQHVPKTPVLSSERAPHIKKTVTVKLINIWSWAPSGARHQDLLTDRRSQCDFDFDLITTVTRVEAGSNTSTVAPRVVGGDEKGSLESETVKYGSNSHGTRTREWLRWRGPAAIVNDRPVLSSERAPHINKHATAWQ